MPKVARHLAEGKIGKMIKFRTIFRCAFLLPIALMFGAFSPAQAQVHEESETQSHPALGVQAMMDELFPKIEEAALLSREDRERIRLSLEAMLDEGLTIRFQTRNEHVRTCPRQEFFDCNLLRSDIIPERELILRYSISIFRELGLAGGTFGNTPLPGDAAQNEPDVEFWINWSQCYQPADFPENAIACAKMYPPLPMPPGPGHIVFQTRDNRVISVMFFVASGQWLDGILERLKEIPES